MSRFNNLPPEIIDQIGSYLNRSSKNAFRQSQRYIEDVLGPTEFDFGEDIPLEMLKEITQYLNPRSKMALRSTSRGTKGRITHIKTLMDDLVQNELPKVKTIEQFENFMEELLTLYYGSEIDSLDIWHKLFDYGNFKSLLVNIKATLKDRIKPIHFQFHQIKSTESYIANANPYRIHGNIPIWLEDFSDKLSSKLNSIFKKM